MQYMGGKSKIAKELSAVILANAKSRKYYLEPFIGGGSVFPHLAPHFEWSVAGDAHEDLVLMWNALIFDGWVPPDTITEEQYAELKESDPSALRAFVGFGSSFGGKFFRGYARGDGGRNYASNAKGSLNRKVKPLTGASIGRFRNWSYADWNPVAGTVVYCDPPYADTTKYATGGFDHTSFWLRAEEWADAGCEVFVSEYTAPDHWTAVWTKIKSVDLGGGGKSFPKTERLFTLTR